MPISREEEDCNCWPTSPTSQQVQKGMHFPGRRKIKELTKLKVYSENTSPAESSPVIKSPPPVLRERPKHTQPSPPNELVKLHQIVKKVHILYKKACTTTGTYWKEHKFVTQEGSSTSDVRYMHFLWHGGSLSPAKWLELILASMIRLYGSRQKEIYVDWFGFLTSLEDVTDDIKS